MKHSLAILFLLFGILSGCSSPATEGRRLLSQPIPPGYARLYVYRTATFVGGGLAPHLWIDGIEKGVLQINTVFAFDITPGTHAITINGSPPGFPFPSSMVNVEAVDGRKVYYRYGAIVVGQETRSYRSRIKTTTLLEFGLYPVPPEEASAEVTGI